jgi:hypothetical protein
MGAQMESARSRNHNKMGFLGIGVLKTANSAKSIKKSQKQRQKRLKERENLRVALRKQNLERKFRLKMAQRGEITELKKLKKFLNQNISKHKQKSDQALKMNEIKRLRTISIATPGGLSKILNETDSQDVPFFGDCFLTTRLIGYFH